VTLARCLGEPTQRSLQQRKLERRAARLRPIPKRHQGTGCSRARATERNLAALLLSASQPYNPRLIRAGSQLISDPAIDLKALVFEAAKERRCYHLPIYAVKKFSRTTRSGTGCFEKLKPIFGIESP
jgi:hypothetical protein